VWRRAALATDPRAFHTRGGDARVRAGRTAWLAGAGVLAAAFGALAWRRHRALRCSASQLRWLVLGVWALVAVNDFFALPAWMGMDYDGHLAYVRFILERRALPLATDGWEMFQAPLYYAICAGIAGLFGEWNGLVVRSFRLVSVACALGQVEIAYRFARRALPEREDLQKVAIAVSGLMPMGFAVSQGVGNEPLHALLAALTLLVALGLVERDGPIAWREAALLGVLWGLALLAKTSAVLLAVPLASRAGAADPARTRRVAARAGFRLARGTLHARGRGLVLRAQLDRAGHAVRPRCAGRRRRVARGRLLVAGAGLSHDRAAHPLRSRARAPVQRGDPRRLGQLLRDAVGGRQPRCARRARVDPALELRTHARVGVARDRADGADRARLRARARRGCAARRDRSARGDRAGDTARRGAVAVRPAARVQPGQGDLHAGAHARVRGAGRVGLRAFDRAPIARTAAQALLAAWAALVVCAYFVV
jgi:hypothetical protein